MRILIFSVFFLLIVSNSFAAIYQSRDANGNIIFSDKKSEKSTEKVLPIKPSVITIKKNVTKKKPVDGMGNIKVEEKKAVRYKNFAIVSPINDKAVRSNIGNIEMKLSIQPSLQIKFGHQIKVEFDGKLSSSSWKTTSILFSNIDRGTHSFKAHILDKKGKRLKSSKSVIFHLQRFSRLN